MTWIADPNNMIGTVVGNTSTDSYGFILRSLRAKVGDIVATMSAIPDDAKSHKNAIIWGRIVSIDRHNPFFPAEAAQELAEQNLRLIDTVLSTSRDYLNAEVLILGSSDEDGSENLELSPLTYPVQPAARVINPPAATIKKLLGAAQDNVPKLHIGTLLGRADVEVSLAANKVVSRHLAILAMTGGGKTVAARRVILALIDHGYPIVIFDPHGDYLGLYESRAKLPAGTDVKLFYPMMKVSEENVTLVSDLLAKMGKKMSEAQHDFFSKIVTETKFDNGTKASDYIQELIEHAERIAANIARKDKDGEAEDTPKKFGAMTVNAVKRSLSFVLSALRQAVRFPLLVKVQLDKEFESSKIGDEDFLKAAAGWNESEARSRNQGIFTATAASEKPATANTPKPQDKAAKPGRQEASELKFSAVSKRKR